MVTLQNEYYLRTILLLSEGGSYIAKLIIGRELPKYGGDLHKLLKNAKTKLQHEFHKKQMEKLFPNGGYDETDVHKWDIQMLVGVILLLFRSTLSNDEKQKLREIKLIRHEVLAHSPSASLYVEKYEDVNKQLGEAINELASGFDQRVKEKCKNYILTSTTHSLDVNSAIKRLKEAKDTDDLFHEVIRAIKQSEDNLSTEMKKVEQNIRQDVKDTKQMLSTELKSVEGCINKEIKHTENTLSDELKVICSLHRVTKHTLSKEISVVQGSVTLTRETLVKKIEKLEGIECNTFHALKELSNEIKCLQQLVMSVKLKGTSDKITSSADLQDVSEKLKHKSQEVKKRILSYDEATSEQYGDVSTYTQPESKSIVTRHDKSSHFFVAAIDFGTTYSGLAFSGRDKRDDPSKIQILPVKKDMEHFSFKAPTAVLFEPNGEFHSFGFDAEDKYSDLSECNEHKDWYFFKRFKMILYTKRVDRNLELAADCGRKMKASDVFGAAIKYFKDRLTNEMMSQVSGYTFIESDILWVLTVPAIWTDQAKQFMREAAYKAGIDNLTVALEPEVASIYCQTISNVSERPDDRQLACIRSGMKYMVIDLGGGTADVTVHEKQIDGSLREVYKASGGAWGGTKVDDEIYRLLAAIFNEQVFLKFCDEEKEDYLYLQREIERKKRNISKHSSGFVTLNIPIGLLNLFASETNKSTETAIQEAGYTDRVKIQYDKLRIKAETFIDLFKPCCDAITNHISNLLSLPPIKGTNVFLMVGGFSKCLIMQDHIKSTFPNVNVIVPKLAELAVMQGAVIFGHEPLAISSRFSKHTYGISISPPFDPSIHPESRRVRIDGNDRCRDVFMKYIGAGENVRVGDPRSGEHSTLRPYQKEIVLKMYASTEINPMYVDDENTKYIGNVVVRLQGNNMQSVVRVKMMFGQTELMVEATDLSQGTIYSAYFDFL